MGDKGKKDKGKREEHKKGQSTLKEKRKTKHKRQSTASTVQLPDQKGVKKS